ncbi:ScbR family autoregulator-binding transcription factor [Streptomyces sp. NPDC005533]|uniref:ScbR family autoregulator-binding transcription factor n=1 Tax=Streptomyces sp. NPDC005533 TaxID=3364723 RepID=UPI00369C5BC2
MQERSERTRRRLVHAAAEMFHRNGYASATLGEIAGAAGVTKGALYFHFASKDELGEAVQQRGYTLLHEEVRSLRESGAPPLQALIDITHWLAGALYEDPAIPASFRITKECGAGPRGPVGAQSVVVDFHAAWIAVVCTLLRLARDAGELPAAEREWEGAEALVAAVACGIEVMSGAGTPYGELRRKVAALWARLLPSLVAAEDVGKYRTRPPVGAAGGPGSGGAAEFLGAGHKEAGGGGAGGGAVRER